ncbi:hypothetical protein RQV73_001408 [Vibrio fluvialis]|nr:hypothetical protein [Vibrio fluvialis]EKO3999409.1 hypothetical protein [Vibrio fluvialis]ELI1838742.1 hypothetical protein [Vibrio fluvialis]KQH86970.1 hypothetical protein AMR75_19480 [Vibrio fluvialis]
MIEIIPMADVVKTFPFHNAYLVQKKDNLCKFSTKIEGRDKNHGYSVTNRESSLTANFVDSQWTE